MPSALVSVCGIQWSSIGGKANSTSTQQFQIKYDIICNQKDVQ